MRQKLYFYDYDTPVSRQEYLFLQSLLPKERLTALYGKPETFVRNAVLGEALTRMAACEWFYHSRLCEGTISSLPGRKLCQTDVTYVTRLFQNEPSPESCAWMKALQILSETHGKKFFPEYPELHFNLSHSGHRIVCILSNVPVGIDMEKPTALKNVAALVKRFFHPTEAAAFARAASDDNAAAFDFLYDEPKTEISKPEPSLNDHFQKLWTMKEAYLKCTGVGISAGMDDFYFKPDENGDGYRVISDPPDGGTLPLSDYILWHFREKDGYAVTICSHLPH